MVKSRNGFTIVELLIVIVVIAILAAISIVAYRGIQERARASQASAGLAQAKKKLELYKIDNSTYPATGNLSIAGVADTDVSYQYTSDGVTYCLTATVGTTSYKTTSTSTPEQGGCAGHGQGGVAAITNLVENPKVKNNDTGWTPAISSGGTGTGTRMTGVTTPLAGVDTLYRVTISTAPSSWWRARYIPSSTFTAGDTYTLSAWMRPSVACNTTLIFGWYNASAAYMTDSGNNASHAANTWQYRTTTVTVPAGAVSARVQFGCGSTVAAGSYLDITGVMLEKSSQMNNFADGDSPNWIWNGTSNNSTSTGPVL